MPTSEAPTIRELKPRREFTSSERGVLRSRYPAVVEQMGMRAAANYDHENVMRRGQKGVLLHGMAIVRAEGVENTTACQRCQRMTEGLDRGTGGEGNTAGR